MLFNSFVFWAFFAVVFALYRLFPYKLQNRVLLLASYFFYGCWDWRFLSLIIVSTVVDYYAALGIQSSSDSSRRKQLLTLSMLTNLGILGVFKYFGFFAHELTGLFSALGIPALLPTLSIVLPVGISFYTFQTMSYTIDVYRGDCKPTRQFWDFALYVCFFPQLVAGPIERSSRFLPQILKPRSLDSTNFSEGLFHVLFGLFKKVVIADNMAPIVNTIFGTPTNQLSGVECLVGVYAFALQIYGDFSGYSSIAKGLGKWLGFDLMTNFRMPYFANNPSDFWKRWHISLSGWLRDYLYIPLGGSKGGRLLTYRNLLLTMILGGLWHGAGWTFIAWGLFHGLLLCGYRVYDHLFKDGLGRRTGTIAIFKAFFSRVLFFHFVCFGWLLFRAESMSQVFSMLNLMVDAPIWTPLATSVVTLMLFFAVPMLLFELWLERRGDLLSLVRVHWIPRAAAYSYCALMLIIFIPPVQNEFIYFQF